MFQIFALLISTAFAHGTHEHTPPVFKLKWAWDPTLLFFLFMAVLYIRGLIAYRGKAPIAVWQKFIFFLGIAILTIASLPPVDTLADQLFSAHMVQHLLITAVGIPLIMLGAPFYVSIRGLNSDFRTKSILPILNHPAYKLASQLLQKPLVATALYEFVFWFWHVPYFYNLALLNDVIHLLEHACMALAAMNLWRIIIDAAPLRSRTTIPVRILLLGFLMTLDTALSAALTYSQKVWYAYDQLPLPHWWNWDRLQDQRLGGLMMWVPGGVSWLVAIIALVFVWAKRERLKELNQ